MRRRIERDVGRGKLLPAASSLLALFQSPYGLFQPPEIHVESDGLYMPRLLAAEQVAGAPQFQIAERNAITRSQIRMMLEHLQTFLRLGVDKIGNEQVTEGATVTPPHPPPQLVKLCETEAVRAVHDHRVRVGYIEPRLDDHGGHEHIHFASNEPAHHRFEIGFAHLAVSDGKSRPRRQ